MYRSLFLTVVTLWLCSQPLAASWNAPLVGRHEAMPQRRQNCDEGNGVTNQDQISRIVSDACNASPQNDYWTCYNQLVLYIRQSAANTCALRYALYNDCLIRNKSAALACLDYKKGWDECSNYAVDVYQYCACWYTMPADLYDCANVILQIRPNALIISTIPTSVLLSTALLTGPILPATAALTTQTSRSAASTAVSIAIVAVEPQPLLTVYQAATVLVTDCGTSVTNCPVTTRVTSYPVLSIPSTVSLPVITPTIAHTLPLSFSASTTSKKTTISVSLETHTFTATITSCPAIVTNCAWDYSSISIFTSTVTKTRYSCDGGCDEAAPSRPATCVQSKRVRLVKRGEL